MNTLKNQYSYSLFMNISLFTKRAGSDAAQAALVVAGKSAPVIPQTITKLRGWEVVRRAHPVSPKGEEASRLCIWAG